MPYLMPKKLSIITERDKLRARRKLIPRWRPGATGAVEDYVFLRRKIPRTPWWIRSLALMRPGVHDLYYQNNN
jgi:hypothetical protein